MSETRITLWEFLGVPATCSVDELKSAWRRKAKELHPDTNGGDTTKTQLFVAAKNVYEKVLKQKEAGTYRPPQPKAPAQQQSTNSATTGFNVNYGGVNIKFYWTT